MSQDASEPFKIFSKKFDAVLTNPPFGKLEISSMFGTYEIKSLEQLMALYALETMKDNGRAAIIIGGHTVWDDEGRIQKGKNRIFFSYLYQHYFVDDVINISGRHLYSRQGTAFNTRIILISGRKQVPEGYAPLQESDKISSIPNSPETVDNFEDLFKRIVVQ